LAGGYPYADTFAAVVRNLQALPRAADGASSTTENLPQPPLTMTLARKPGDPSSPTAASPKMFSKTCQAARFSSNIFQVRRRLLSSASTAPRKTLVLTAYETSGLAFRFLSKTVDAITPM